MEEVSVTAACLGVPDSVGLRFNSLLQPSYTGNEPQWIWRAGKNSIPPTSLRKDPMWRDPQISKFHQAVSRFQEISTVAGFVFFNISSWEAPPLVKDGPLLHARSARIQFRLVP